MIKMLRRAGYIAAKREWSLGDTVSVSHPKFGRLRGGEFVASEIVYVRESQGMLLVTDSENPLPEPHFECCGTEGLMCFLAERFGSSSTDDPL
ncbi:MAG: hypothetical protein RID81_24325 [Sandaracinaceae bacterium]